jgi:hypothetical protein
LKNSCKARILLQRTPSETNLEILEQIKKPSIELEGVHVILEEQLDEKVLSSALELVGT